MRYFIYSRTHIMPKASELKRGMVVELVNEPYVVKDIEIRNPSSRGAATLYKVRFNHLKNKQKRDESLKGEDFLKEVDCERKLIQFSYQDGDSFVFMDNETFEQYAVNGEDIKDELGYISDGLDNLVAVLLEQQLIAIELPASVNLTIIETSPGIKGATAAARTKPATLSTGIEVQVPEYIENGEVIKVNTTTGKFMSRA
ncbi:elongation factor P-like protein EfpL [Methylophaga thiooxydans]|uniref:Elongation factor P-like protein n=1 Tax=Methylophaga thiooxydans DMS010 TaxID=637616 RepID=C0N2M2_9GAMM|nr:elongation factor P-like protein YeiP [Methylophaga thiooxydans]EEF80981.1 putative elongation factor P [Methylophaga thiooxydans DMS010]